MENILLKIEEHEKNLLNIEELEELTEKVKKDKKFLKTVSLPDFPLSWSSAKDLYSKRINALHGSKKVVCSSCHLLKSRGSGFHECSPREHSFSECELKFLKGIFHFT